MSEWARLVLFAVPLAWLLVAGSARAGEDATRAGSCRANVSVAREAGTSRDDESTPYYLVILVDAAGYDYSTPASLLRSFHQPALARKRHGVGHAWFVLGRGDVTVEGGHTGEYGLYRPRYYEGVLAGIRHGDVNPIAYLWEEMEDGRFEPGSGGHRPTAACWFDLAEEDFRAALRFVESYDYRAFALQGRLCTDLVTGAAESAGIRLGHELTVEIPPDIGFRGESIHLWDDPVFDEITFGMPDVLQASLQLAAEQGYCRDVLGGD